MSKKVLLIGSGGREHAIAKALAASAGDPRIHALPGNPGTAQLGENVSGADGRDPLSYCRARGIDLVVVGPEDPLIDGIADTLRDGGIPVFGPGAAGARLEGDKLYAKALMAAAGVPTAAYESFSELAPALEYLDAAAFPLVVKACGAAQGKGVAVCRDRDSAAVFLEDCLTDGRFGDAGRQVLIETCLEGPELSVLVMTDGESYALLAPSRDHKRVGEGDTGPNTGGMGAFASGALVPEGLGRTICDRIVEPVLAELGRRRIDYRGVLYVGLMLTDSGPKVLEFNCRFGDPETQVVLPLLDCDFLDLVTAVSTGGLGRFLADLPVPEAAPDCWPGAGLTDWNRTATVVVGAARGYPGAYEKGSPIGLTRPDDDRAWVIHAGTAMGDGDLVTAGGRVLGAVGIGDDFKASRGAAYGMIESIECADLFYRRDIGAAFND